MAALNDHVETLLKMWIWAEESQLNPKELKKNLFLAKDNDAFIGWHLPSLEGRRGALETLWSWAKEAELNTDELLISQTVDGYTAFQFAAWKMHVQTMWKMWVWVEETQLNPKELEKNLFPAEDNNLYIALQVASSEGNIAALDTLWSWAKMLN